MKTKTKFKTRDLTLIAMLGAICCVLILNILMYNSVNHAQII